VAQSPPPVEKDPFQFGFKFDDNAFLYLLDEQSEQPSADGDKLRGELKALEASLEEKLRDTQKIKAQIEQMRSKLKSVVQSKEFKSGTGTIQLMLDSGDGKQPHEIVLRNVNGVWTIVNPNEKTGDKVVGKIVTTTGNPTVTETKGTVVVEPKGVVEYKVNPAVKTGAAAAQPSADANQRIDNLEKKLDKLMDVLEQMRKELDGSGKKSGAEADKKTEQLRVAEAIKRAMAEKDAAIVREKRAADQREIELKRDAEQREKELKRAADERDRDLKRAQEEREKERKRAADERAIEQKRAAEERAIAAEQRTVEQKRQAEQRQLEVQRVEALRERERAIQAELKSLEVLRREIEDSLKKQNPDSKKSGAKEPKEPKPDQPK
jgi:hypothetical protein